VCGLGAAALIRAIQKNPNLVKVGMDDAGVPIALMLKAKRLLGMRTSDAITEDEMLLECVPAPSMKVVEVADSPPKIWPSCFDKALQFVPSLPQQRTDEELNLYVQQCCQRFLLEEQDPKGMVHHKAQRCLAFAAAHDWVSCSAILRNLRQGRALMVGEKITCADESSFLLHRAMEERHGIYWKDLATYCLEDPSRPPTDLFEDIAEHCPTRLLAFLIYLATVGSTKVLWDANVTIPKTLTSGDKRDMAPIVREFCALIVCVFGTQEKHAQLYAEYRVWRATYPN
jgi:hypothetical protein